MIDWRLWENSPSGPKPSALLVVHRNKVMTPAMTEIAGRIERAFGGTAGPGSNQSQNTPKEHS